jgi:competence ComEA-like helix-hairpin-helix protein
MARGPFETMLSHSHSLLFLRPLSVSLLSLTLILSTSACFKRADSERARTLAATGDQQPAASIRSTDLANQTTSPRLNINTASAKDLEELPGIGKALAERIVEYREKYGAFRRPEHLIMVRGISDKRFRALRDLITAD